jgi:hypothetical protein
MATGAPAAPPQAQPPLAMTAASEAPSGSLLDRIKNALNRAGEGVNNNANMLLGLGSGFAGAPNFGAGMSRGFAGAQQGLALDQKQLALNQTVKALVDKGIPSNQALAIATNPTLLQQVAGQLFGPKQLQFQKIKDEFGAEHIVALDPITGKQVNAPGGAGGGIGSGITPSFYAPGVTKQDSSLPAKEYLAQFSPEVQAAVNNYIGGHSMPTGRGSDYTNTIKRIAQTVGEKTGEPVSDELFARRNTMQRGLGADTPGSAGGKTQAIRNAADHFAKLTDAAVAQNNANLWLTPVGQSYNYLKNLTAENAHNVEATKGAAQHYGEEITKFYSGSQGDREARNRFVQEVGGNKTPEETAGLLESELGLLRDAAGNLQGQVTESLGGNAPGPYGRERTLLPEHQAALERAERNIKILRGELPASAAQQPAQAQTASPQIPKEAQGLPINELMKTMPDNSIIRIGSQIFQKTGGAWGQKQEKSQ